MDGLASILLVDDNPKYLADALPMYGYDVTVATNGIDALKELSNEEKNFDMVLLDVMMPQMNGWDTLKAIRSNKKHQYLPVIMITAVNEDQKIELLMFLNSYIETKVKQHKLGDMIENNQLKLI